MAQNQQPKQPDVICKIRTKNRGFSIIDNLAIDDLNISIEALGVYNVLKRWITFEAEGFVCSKSFIMSKSRCKEKKFERIWKELKEAGYIKMYCVGKSNWTAELLEEPEPDTPHTYYLNNAGEITATNLDISAKLADRKETTGDKENAAELEGNSRVPQKRVPLEREPLTRGTHKRGNNINTSFKNSLNNYSMNNQSIYQEEHSSQNDGNAPKEKKIDRLIDNDLIEEIKEQIEYDILTQDGVFSKGISKDDLDNVVDAIAVLKTATEPMKFGDSTYGADYIRQRADQIDSSHVEYVFECFYENREEVRNIKKYLTAAVFNAPATIGAFYSNRVRSAGMI